MSLIANITDIPISAPSVHERIAALAKHLDLAEHLYTRPHGSFVIECLPNKIVVNFSRNNVHIELHPLRRDPANNDMEPLLATARSMPFLAKMRRYRERWNEHGHKLDGERFRTMAVMAALFGYLLPEDV